MIHSLLRNRIGDVPRLATLVNRLPSEAYFSAGDFGYFKLPTSLVCILHFL